MEKFFNTAGPSVSEDNYMIDPLRRVNYDDLRELIDRKRYFILHAPRQTGKTTSLLAMVKFINDEGKYNCIYMNAESAQTARNDVVAGMETIVTIFMNASDKFIKNPPRTNPYRSLIEQSGGHAMFVNLLTDYCKNLSKPLVLFIDEIDSLIGDTLVSALRQLRSGYADRPERFPMSVILCGVRDIRDYRIHRSDGEIITGGSCFNIKAESLRLGDFSPDEIRELYEQHTAATGQVFEDDVYPKIWDLTHGQPWLVNALAHQATSKMPEGKNRAAHITLEVIEEASNQLILSRATHLDQLTDKLREPRVRRVISPMITGGGWPETSAEKPSPDDIEYLIDLGLLRRLGVEQGKGLVISNDIYKEIIPRELTTIMEDGMSSRPAQPWYVATDGKIDMTRLLREFQQFFRENIESWDNGFDYREAGFQLLLQAFLQRVINGGGQIEREYALGRGRVDILARWRYPKSAQRANQNEQRIVIELKTIRKSRGPERVLSEGLEQTSRYADQAGASEAHLVICDERPGVSWDEKIYERSEKSNDREILVWGA